MNLTLIRDRFNEHRTMGRLLYNGDLFGFTVEDADRGLDESWTLEAIAAAKIPKLTCIPVGMHSVVLQNSTRFGPDTLTVLVPGYRTIRVHPGVTEHSTEGCLCPGTRRTDTTVQGSANAVRWLRGKLVPHLRAGGDVWIRIVREPDAWALAPFNPNRRIAS